MTGIRDIPDRLASVSAWRSVLSRSIQTTSVRGNHHLADDGVAEIEDALQHLPLGLLDHPAAAGDVDQFAQFDVRGERALPEAAARGDRVADQDQQRRHRRQQPGQAPGRAGQRQPDAVVGCWRPMVRGSTPITT